MIFAHLILTQILLINLHFHITSSIHITYSILLLEKRQTHAKQQKVSWIEQYVLVVIFICCLTRLFLLLGAERIYEYDHIKIYSIFIVRSYL